MKLVIYDAAWRMYLPLIRDNIRTTWKIVAGANDLNWLLREIPDAEALIALTLPSEARSSALHLRLLHFPGAGVMHSDPEDLPDGCQLCNVYEHEIPIAEYVMMVILMHVTGIKERVDSFRLGRWGGSGRLGGETHDEVSGKTIGIIGYGHVGQAVASRARAFGLRVLAVRKRPGSLLLPNAIQPDWLGGPEQIPKLLEESDFIVVACPAVGRCLISRRELERLRPGAMLINVGRAELVEEKALYEALRDHQIAAAALDVWYRYPTRLDELSHGSSFPFHELPNVLLTPHLSAWTGAMVERRMKIIAENLDRLSCGLPLENVVMVGAWSTPSRVAEG